MQNVLPSCFEESYGDLRQASPLAKTVLREAFLLGEELIIPRLNAVLGKALQLNEQDRSAGSLPSQIKAAAKRQAHTLPEDWKALISLHLVSSWAKKKLRLRTKFSILRRCYFPS